MSFKIRITSGYGENAISPFFHYKSMGAFCCHGNQTKSQITIILAIFKPPYQSNILNEFGANHINGFGGCRLKVLTNRRTHSQMDDGQKVITIAHPVHSSLWPAIHDSELFINAMKKDNTR